MLKDDTTEMNPKIFLFVNPYEVNPGNSRLAQSGNDHSSTSQIFPISVKTDSGDHNSYEYQEASSKRVKLEMEEFSDLGDLIPSARERSAMDELDFSLTDPEGMTDLTMRSYESASLKDLVDAQDFHKCENNQQLYIDNQHVNLEDISGEEFNILQQELTTSCANSALNEQSNNNNNKIIQNSSLRDRESSNIFNFEEADLASPFVIDNDHAYANMSSPSDTSITPQYSPMGIQDTWNGFSDKQIDFKNRLSELNLGVKLFVADTLNTPDILESVVSLEDDRFNFLRHLDKDQELKTINENDLLFQPQSSPECNIPKVLAKIEPEPLADTRWSFKPEEYDDDDDDYVPPKKARIHKKMSKVIKSDSESDEDYVPSKTAKKRTRRISSISSDSSKDSSRVSKYRELRDKNNEASRKSRLKRKLKEQEMEVEMQGLVNKNVKLNAKVEELKRMVDNFRSNLFKIMAQK
ncbi:uncharacterized protein LOC123675004 [Harmonia axyridis]|uniref:uncharacterized protein LOC123675004 n=1 Tax=Harmonia axyridis TaxID=115357 RepID=UPI001E278790|nr:uncharacterized protein LOC123675004 [Harmonia axyridis]XP_045466191.1 uncharacterized protein LOC123675004 [Harmonia axyridis]